MDTGVPCVLAAFKSLLANFKQSHKAQLLLGNEWEKARWSRSLMTTHKGSRWQTEPAFVSLLALKNRHQTTMTPYSVGRHKAFISSHYTCTLTVCDPNPLQLHWGLLLDTSSTPGSLNQTSAHTSSEPWLPQVKL